MNKKIFVLDDFVNAERSEGKIHYTINKEKRTIVAYMTNCQYDAIYAAEKIDPSLIYTYGANPARYMINDTYRGKAICDVNDDWDEDKGKAIARDRLLFKYYGAKYDAFMRFQNDLLEKVERVQAKIEYCDEKATDALYMNDVDFDNEDDEHDCEEVDEDTNVPEGCSGENCPIWDACHGEMIR